jgi:hypothetical protein
MTVKGKVFSVSEGTSKKGEPCRFYRVAEPGARELLTVYESAPKGQGLGPRLADEGSDVEFEVRTDFCFLTGFRTGEGKAGLRKAAGL